MVGDVKVMSASRTVICRWMRFELVLCFACAAFALLVGSSRDFSFGATSSHTRQSKKRLDLEEYLQESVLISGFVLRAYIPRRTANICSHTYEFYLLHRPKKTFSPSRSSILGTDHRLPCTSTRTVGPMTASSGCHIALFLCFVRLLLLYPVWPPSGPFTPDSSFGYALLDAGWKYLPCMRRTSTSSSTRY